MGIKIIFQRKSEEEKKREEKEKVENKKKEIKENFEEYKTENHAYWRGFLQAWQMDYIKSLGWELITFDAWAYEYIFKRIKSK